MKMQWVEVDYDKPKPSLKVSTIKLNNTFNEHHPASSVNFPERAAELFMKVVRKFMESTCFFFAQIENDRETIYEQLFKLRSALDLSSYTAPARIASRKRFLVCTRFFIYSAST